MNVRYTTPFLGVSRVEYILPGAYVVADCNDSGQPGKVSLAYREGEMTYLSFDHQNPKGAAETLVHFIQRGLGELSETKVL